MYISSEVLFAILVVMCSYVFGTLLFLVFKELIIWFPRLLWASFCQMRDEHRAWKADFKRRFNSHYHR